MEIDGVFSAIIFGAIIGALGRLVLPGRQNIPIWLTILVGIVAGLVGTLVAGGIGVAHTSGPDWVEMALQIGLAVLGVAAVSGVMSRRGRTRSTS